MAEAVFTVSAEITPTIDERALQQQANLLSNQFNNLLAKKIDPIAFKAPISGSFRPFQQEVVRTRNALQTFTQDLGNKVPKAISGVARAGKGAFLKFTDAINVTRRDIVGFSGSIIDTVKNTNLFENALDGIKSSGSTISELPGRFEELSAQIRSGTSALDQAALNGDRLAQVFQPIQRQGEAARTEFVELNRTLDTLTLAVAKLATASGGLDTLGSNKAKKSGFEQQIDSARKLQEIAKNSPALFNEIKDSIDFASVKGPEELAAQLLQIKDNAQKVTGPMGRIMQLINEQSGGKFFKEATAEARKLQIEIEQGVIGELKAMDREDLIGPLEGMNASFRKIGDGAKTAFNGLNAFRMGVANILPGKSPFATLGDESLTFFRVLRSEGVPSLQAIQQAFSTAFSGFKGTTGITSAVASIKGEFAGLGAFIVQSKIGQKVNASLGNTGDFLNKNLVGPLRNAGPQIKSALATVPGELKSIGGQIKGAFRGVGADVVNGFGLGVKNQKGSAVKELRKLADDSRKELQNRLGIHSASTELKKDGRDTVLGYAQGINQNKGIVKKALAGIGDAVKAIGAELARTAKSAAAVAGATFAGLGAVALKTGADFNILKQVIGATLPVLVGSKQGAAGLLEEVNLLNNSSPFARSSFLELTRVLAGFGVEAKRITPLIDAIQQTVAATGGSDEDLLELGQAFAKIQSQGKVSADVLQSFSVRGVDAVGVLAKGFNVTTGAMREMISDGLVPADKAIDILTKGLKEKFDGATAAVAKNFPGALQRVQARLRDIGGLLLTSFINPAGGGALVDFLNNMADSLLHVQKQLVPVLLPALELAGRALTVFSEKVESVVTSLSGDEFAHFIAGLKPWLPILAALAGLIPAAFGFIPVIGPIIAGLGGPFTAAAAGIAVFLAQTGQLSPTLKGVSSGLSSLKDAAGGVGSFIQDNFAGVVAGLLGASKTVGSVIAGITGGVGRLVGLIPGLGGLGKTFGTVGAVAGGLTSKFGNLAPITTKLVSLFPNLAKGLKFLTGPVGLVISIFVQLVLTSQKFRESLVRLFNAVKPVLAIIAGAFAVGIKVMNEAVKAAAPLFAALVNILAAVFEKISPVTKAIAGFLKNLAEGNKIEKFFGGIKDAISTAVDIAVTAINLLIKAYNAIPFLDNVSEIKFSLDMEDDPFKKAQAEAKKKQEAFAKAAADSADAIEDNYTKAAKGVELARQHMDAAIDGLKQGLSSIDQKLSPVFEAAKAVQSANKAVTDARKKDTEATADLAKIQTDYAKAMRDSVSPTDELNKALRDQTRVKNGIRDIDQQLDDIERNRIELGKERLKLSGQEAEDDRAGLARSEERAQIALNRARQSEVDLLNELNGLNKVSLDLAGLSLDQIRDKIAAARLSSSKDRKKTAQEIADEKATARLDVLDAEQAKKDATQARADFELDTTEKIRDIDVEIRELDEQKASLQDDRLDALLDEEEARKKIIKLQEGETTQAAIVLDFTDKIKDATEKQKDAQEAIKSAVDGQNLANIELKLASATLRDNAKEMATYQQQIWDEKRKGIAENLDGQTLTAIGNQKGKVQELLDKYKEVTAELKKALSLQASSENIKALGGSVSSAEGAAANLAGGRFVPPALIDTIKKNLARDLTAILSAGVQKNGENVTATPQQISRGLAMLNTRLAGPSLPTNIRDIIRDIIHDLGFTAPGFAAARGLSPGMIHRGMNDGKGLVRMFEFGKEAVLPLTRPRDMARIVGDPRVLPEIMKALPGFDKGFAPGDVIDMALTSPSSRLRSLLKEIFEKLGLQFPGFAEGYAPGDTINSGMNKAFKSFSLPDVSTSGLPAILNALPRWSRPDSSSTSDIATAAGDLSTAVRSGRMGGSGPANADVYEKKNQREFADTIGEAVRVAVKAALEESDGLGDRNATINVNPNASETQRMIAREVKRQLDKATGKW